MCKIDLIFPINNTSKKNPQILAWRYQSTLVWRYQNILDPKNCTRKIAKISKDFGLYQTNLKRLLYCLVECQIYNSTRNFFKTVIF